MTFAICCQEYNIARGIHRFPKISMKKTSIPWRHNSWSALITYFYHQSFSSYILASTKHEVGDVHKSSSDELIMAKVIEPMLKNKISDFVPICCKFNNGKFY